MIPVRYPVISESDAAKYLRGQTAGDLIQLEGITSFQGVGAPLSVTPLETLKEFLGELRESGHFPKSMATRSEEGGRFETEAVSEVHRVFSLFPRNVLADRRFWIWSALAHFSEIINWRFGADEAPAKEANYGIGDRGKDNLLYRMWLRGEIGRDPATGNIDLVTTGKQDLWRSHIIRQNYAVAGEIARGILRLQAHMLGVPPLTNPEVRELAKLLKRLNTNLYLALLTRDEAEQLLLELVPIAKDAAKTKKKKK